MAKRDAKRRIAGPERAADQVRNLAPAKITLLYESRDKKLCLFEDAHGHLTAVRASRLANE